MWQFQVENNSPSVIKRQAEEIKARRRTFEKLQTCCEEFGWRGNEKKCENNNWTRVKVNRVPFVTSAKFAYSPAWLLLSTVFFNVWTSSALYICDLQLLTARFIIPKRGFSSRTFPRLVVLTGEVCGAGCLWRKKKELWTRKNESC